MGFGLWEGAAVASWGDRWWMVQEDRAGWRPESAGVQEDLAGGTLAAARFHPRSLGDREALMPGRQPSRWLQELSDHAGLLLATDLVMIEAPGQALSLSVTEVNCVSLFPACPGSRGGLRGVWAGLSVKDPD